MLPINLLKEAGHSVDQEHTETLIQNRHIRLQRIESPAKFRSELFQQPEDEWILVLQGEGTLDIAGERITLRTGDYLMIPADTPHQVLTTSTDPLCTWLTLHLVKEEPVTS